MLKSGFQPVCVLYQGNESSFDGSCQLVCRHQIQEENFSQGDNVTVIDLATTSGSSNGRDGPICRQAIVMGQEMVSTMLGTLFHTKQSEEAHSAKKRKITDEQEVQRDDKVRQEEIGMLRGVFSAVKDLREEMQRQGMEISHIKQRQIQMMNLLDGMIRRQANVVQGAPPLPTSADVANPPMMATKVHEVEEEEVVQEIEEVEEVSGPIISSVRSTATRNPERPLGEAYGNVAQVPEGTSSPVSEQGIGNFQEDLMYSAVELSPGQDQGWEQADGLSASVIDDRRGYLEDYTGKWRRGENVEIGNYNFKVLMPVSELEDILYKTNNATSFAYRLAGKCFTSREMVEGNTRGGGPRTDGHIFKQLNPDVVEMITGEVKKRFPGSTTEALLNRSVRNAINERARNERKRIARTQLITKS